MDDLGRAYGRGSSRTGPEGQSLVRYYRVLRERVWLILACTVLALAVAVVYVKVATRTYQATAELLVQPASSSDPVLSSLPVALRQTGDPTEDVLTGASLVSTLPVATAVVRSLHLHISPSTALGDVSASPVGQAGLVAVMATASSPRLAQRLANGFVAQTIATSTANLHSAIRAQLPTLEAQLSAVPSSQRYGPGGLGQTVDEMKTLLGQSDPTLRNAAPASVPTGPSSPKTKLTLAAGLIAGLLLGIAAAFALHAIDPRLRREEQLRGLIDAPILARIPRERYRGRTLPLLPPELSIASLEGFRTLRTMLTARGGRGSSRTYLVTGSAPSEGKSTTAVSLALSLAQGGLRVILIEADLRKPTFAAVFRLTHYYGIEQVLIGEVDLDLALEQVRFEGASMRVLAAHRSGVDFADRLSFGIVRKLVGDANELADAVVIDSPPLTEVIDALPFAQIADEILIVARLDHSRLSRIAELNELLIEHGSTPSGVVLVGETSRPREYYYANDADARPEPRRRRSRNGEPPPDPTESVTSAT